MEVPAKAYGVTATGKCVVANGVAVVEPAREKLTINCRFVEPPDAQWLGVAAMVGGARFVVPMHDQPFTQGPSNTLCVGYFVELAQADSQFDVTAWD